MLMMWHSISSDGKDHQLTKDILQIFGEASGLQTNLQKSCDTHIVWCGNSGGSKQHFAMHYF